MKRNKQPRKSSNEGACSYYAGRVLCEALDSKRAEFGLINKTSFLVAVLSCLPCLSAYCMFNFFFYQILERPLPLDLERYVYGKVDYINYLSFAVFLISVMLLFDFSLMRICGPSWPNTCIAP